MIGKKEIKNEKVDYNQIIDNCVLELDKLKVLCNNLKCRHEYHLAKMHLLDLKILIKQMDNKK